MIKILSIGNSFSQDAQHYLYKIAENEGVSLECRNLYIGGCSLEMHAENIDKGGLYDLERNGVCYTGEKSDIVSALKSENWDFVTLQQVSHKSNDFNTYMPYLSKVSDTVRSYAPDAEILIHQTWAYEQGSSKLNSLMGYEDQHDMLNDIVLAYEKAAKTVGAKGIIRSGEAMMKIAEQGVKAHRDTFHASLGAGRYLISLVWYKTLTGKNIQNGDIALEENVDEKTLGILKRIIRDMK